MKWTLCPQEFELVKLHNSGEAFCNKSVHTMTFRSLLFATLSLLAQGSAFSQETGRKQPFRGKLNDPKLQGYQIAAWPLVKHATSFEIDEKGRFFIVESDRLNGGGVLDIRGEGTLTAGDFRLQTIGDRRKQLTSDKKFKPGFFTNISERIARIEDLNGDGIPDKRTEYAQGMNDVLDGVAFSALAVDGALYLTCIPNLWKFEDTNDDGVADKREKMFTGFGVRTSMMGHDLHGITRGPDGKLYWSVGDRGYNVTTKDGKNFAAPSRGAVFRCDPDGSHFEVIHHGLRNPQELAFDQHGNLFTFDNTGDIGDKARAVYVLEGADSGWYEEHQGPHQYRSRLDFADIALPKSLWVSEQMFAPRNDVQPKWILPPVANVGNGPSGVVYLTGESLPTDLRDTFLVCNYRGNAGTSQLLSVRPQNNGAGFKVDGAKVVMSGVASSDVDLGYDGRIYALDFGGGWRKNKNASIQAIESPEHLKNKSVKETQEFFAHGFAKAKSDRLADLLTHPDMRVRQRSQFELVKRGEKEKLAAAAKSGKATTTRLHGIWGLAQMARKESSLVSMLIGLAKDKDVEVRANVCRSLGDLKMKEASATLRESLTDSSLRVRSLAAIALSKCGGKADAPAIWKLIEENKGEDIWIRHAGITALKNLNDNEGAVAKMSSASVEARLCAVILLRKLDDPAVAGFVGDASRQVQIEAIRAVYDRHLVSGFPALAQLAGKASEFADTVQRRILFASYWMGQPKDAARIMAMAGDPKIDGKVRETALRSLLRWNKPPTMDPVTSMYRPVESRQVKLLAALAAPLRQVMANAKGKEQALALELAKAVNLPMSAKALEAQVYDDSLESGIRVAALNTVAGQNKGKIPAIVEKLKNTKDGEVQAARLGLMFEAELPGRIEAAEGYLKTKNLPAVRAALALLATDTAGKEILTKAWSDPASVMKEARLDAYLALASSSDAGHKKLAAEFAANPAELQKLSLHGGNAEAGAIVFQNQGACMQCHMVNNKGGVQGPALDTLGKRLSGEKILESLVNPSAEIAEGYGLFTLTTKSGEALAGRLGKETSTAVELILPTGETKTVPKAQIKEQAGPTSAMPPMALALPPKDLRNLISYLASLKTEAKKGH
ncbi:MAG: PVC-type heme-binding CxxCH protein [Akkermansiaceae bacterium]